MSKDNAILKKIEELKLSIETLRESIGKGELSQEVKVILATNYSQIAKFTVVENHFNLAMQASENGNIREFEINGKKIFNICRNFIFDKEFKEKATEIEKKMLEKTILLKIKMFLFYNGYDSSELNSLRESIDLSVYSFNENFVKGDEKSLETFGLNNNQITKKYDSFLNEKTIKFLNSLIIDEDELLKEKSMNVFNARVYIRNFINLFDNLQVFFAFWKNFIEENSKNTALIEKTNFATKVLKNLTKDGEFTELANL